jgi:class 3 adenylate cyclase
MLDLPRSVLDYIGTVMIENRLPAYLFVDKDGLLSDWGGSLQEYGINDLRKGEPVGEQILFLEGLLPLSVSPMFLHCIKTEAGLSADIHLFSGEDGDWILLLDVTSDELQHIIIQQKVNDLSLLRKKHAGLLNQYFSTDARDGQIQELITFREKGERKEVAILFVDIRGFNSYSEKTHPEEVFKTLNLYLRAMIAPMLDEGGIVDKIIGDAVVTIFGAIASSTSPAQLAVRTAFRMMNAVGEVNRVRQIENQETFNVGIGIASGTVALGILGSKELRSINAIGHPVKIAAHLGSTARAGEILIDNNSYTELDSIKARFLPFEDTLINITSVYSCLITGE